MPRPCGARWALLAILLSPWLASAADAQRAPLGVRKLQIRLAEAGGEELREALEALGRVRHPAVVDVLEVFLRAGQQDPIADLAIDALGNNGRSEALPLLSELTHHRRSSARRHAYRAIAAIEHHSVPDLVAEGLRDSDAGVRGLAAQLLGELGAHAQLPILFRAFSRGVPEAAAAIGKLGDAESLGRYHGYLQRQPLTVMLAGYDAFLARTDLPLEAKLDIVARLGEVAGLGVKRFLEGLLARLDWKGQARLRHAVVETAKRIDASDEHPAGRPR